MDIRDFFSFQKEALGGSAMYVQHPGGRRGPKGETAFRFCPFQSVLPGAVPFLEEGAPKQWPREENIPESELRIVRTKQCGGVQECVEAGVMKSDWVGRGSERTALKGV